MHLEAGRPDELDEVVAWGKGHRERERVRDSLKNL